jgi:hypothetical protein
LTHKHCFFIGFLFITIFFSAACSNEQAGNKTIVETPIAAEDSTNLVITERINGPANIRDTINGIVAFSLNDSTPVTCTELKNGWFEIGVMSELADTEFNVDTLRAGTAIVVDGKVAGKILVDMPVSTARTNTETWAELTGFTHKDNIYSWSVIEHALTDYLAKQPDRSLESLKPFIKNFSLEADTLSHYTSYFNYENWIDDPSALFRLSLLFDEDRLVGVLHSRPLTFPRSTDYKLERGFAVRFFDDADAQKRESYISDFNEMINTVD